MVKNKPFSGRVVFDHLGKTGGMAVTSWLIGSLGSGTVTPDIFGSHSNLIRRYGGLFPVISAHIDFDEGLDPRYQYITLLRDPIDRIVSWLFYADNTVPDTPEYVSHKKAAREFISSDGDILPDEILRVVSNNYVSHFSQIQKFSTVTIENKVDYALAALKDYKIVGLYEQFPQFLSAVSNLFGLPVPSSIARVNTTSYRLKVDQLSSALRERIIALNQLDLRLYAEVVAWKATTVQKELTQSLPLTAPKWIKYEPVCIINQPTTGSLLVETPVSTMAPGEVACISVTIVNRSEQVWEESGYRPIYLSYHWLNYSGQMFIMDGLRSPFPVKGVGPGQAKDAKMRVEAPSAEGKYILVLTLIQESVVWFEDKGFEAARLNVEVISNSHVD